MVRTQISFYGSTPAYHGVFAVHGLEDLGLKLNRLSREGRWGDMIAAVPDDLVRLFAAVGRWDEIVPIVRERFRGISRLAFYLVGTDAKHETQVRELLQALRS